MLKRSNCDVSNKNLYKANIRRKDERIQTIEKCAVRRCRNESLLWPFECY